MRPDRLLLIFILFSFFTSGCFIFTTKKEGQALARELDESRKKITSLENSLEVQSKKLLATILQANEEMKRLDKVIKKATRVLARNSADFGAELESVKSTIRKVNGSISEITHEMGDVHKNISDVDARLKNFAIAAGLDLPVDEEKISKNPKAHIELAQKAFDEGHFGETRSLCRLFVKRHLKNKLTAKARLLTGKSYIEQKRWAKALGAFRRFADKHKTHKDIPEALYLMAKSFFMLGDCTDARILTNIIKTSHSKSKFAKKALILDETMKTQSSRCTS